MGRGCSSEGSFTLESATFALDGTPTSFAISFAHAARQDGRAARLARLPRRRHHPAGALAGRYRGPASRRSARRLRHGLQRPRRLGRRHAPARVHETDATLSVTGTPASHRVGSRWDAQRRVLVQLRGPGRRDARRRRCLHRRRANRQPWPAQPGNRGRRRWTRLQPDARELRGERPRDRRLRGRQPRLDPLRATLRREQGGRMGRGSVGTSNEPTELVVPSIVRWPETDVGARETVVPVTLTSLDGPVGARDVSSTALPRRTSRSARTSVRSGRGRGDVQVWLRFVPRAPGTRLATLHLGGHDVPLQGFARPWDVGGNADAQPGRRRRRRRVNSFAPPADAIGSKATPPTPDFVVYAEQDVPWVGYFQPSTGDTLTAGTTYDGEPGSRPRRATPRCWSTAARKPAGRSPSTPSPSRRTDRCARWHCGSSSSARDRPDPG